MWNDSVSVQDTILSVFVRGGDIKPGEVLEGNHWFFDLGEVKRRLYNLAQCNRLNWVEFKNFEALLYRDQSEFFYYGGRWEGMQKPGNKPQAQTRRPQGRQQARAFKPRVKAKVRKAMA